MHVQVAIDLALDRLFTYEVPEALQEKLAVGQLLSVPFGHREARGFAIGIDRHRKVSIGIDQSISTDTCRCLSIPNPPAKPIRLRPVTAIVDETPFFSPALLELVKRVAAYTAAPLESVLKTALPAAVLKRNARAKEQLFVEAESTGQEGREGQEGPETTARQKWLFEQIVRLGGGWMSQLCRELKTTPASLKALAEKGVVTIEVKAMRRDPLQGGRILPSKPLPLNQEQQAALDLIEGRDLGVDKIDRGIGIDSEISTISKYTIDTCRRLSTLSLPRPSPVSRPLLLFGVTGSGKTEVYLQAIARELEAGRGAIVMVPEISLTPQTVRRFASRFGDKVAVLHSALSDGERYDEWHRIRSGTARVVVGPRSAVWAPVRDLGLIVVDEEHDTSYKQSESPHYHARDVAVLRGQIEGARVVLGSATPSLESWTNVAKGKYLLAEMRQRAGSGKLPSVRLVEMAGGAIFSQDLLEAVRLRLDRHEQSILFLNRRGFSRAYVCAGCGACAECPECGVPYTYHRADSCLRCHVCGRWIPLPQQCPRCGCSSFDCRGIGTQRAEAALVKCFPKARVLRMDSDSVSRKNSHDDLLSAFRRGEADILLGTQMIAKGLDFPNVTLVGVLNADASLNLPDFRAAERTYQLLAQVAGRAGRAELPGEVLIQSHDVSAPVLNAVVRGSFASFAESELRVRKECFFPPFCHLAVIGFRSKNLKQVANWATMYAKSLAAYAANSNNQTIKQSNNFLVSEATPCALEKADGWYRWQVVLRAASASTIVRAWKWIVRERPTPAGLRVSIDVDAIDVL